MRDRLKKSNTCKWRKGLYYKLTSITTNKIKRDETGTFNHVLIKNIICAQAGLSASYLGTKFHQNLSTLLSMKTNIHKFTIILVRYDIDRI